MGPGGARMILGAFDFGDAIDFIVNGRESVTGGLRVGGSQLLPQLWRHLELTGASVGIACLLAIPIGLWLGHLRKGQFAVASVANVGRAVPSLALIGFAVAYIGLGFPNALLALTLLAIPPIFVNAYVGVAQVEPEIVDASRGQGMTEPGIVRHVELPLAIPLVFGGIRTSVVNVIATATIAPLIGVVTLGDAIVSPQVYGDAGQLGAAICVALLALAAEIVFALIQRAVTPRGLKLQSARTRGSLFPLRRRIA
jgi:ABC-type proline/glycine betaine transport system permease subunit